MVPFGEYPQPRDQLRRLAYVEVEVEHLRSERPKPARIRAAVRRVLADPTYAANVDALRAELDAYDPMARIEAALHGEPIATRTTTHA